MTEALCLCPIKVWEPEDHLVRCPLHLSGLWVKYHGSLTDYAGHTMRVLDAGPHDLYTTPEDPKRRYDLRYGPKWSHYLCTVRRESFTVLEDQFNAGYTVYPSLNEREDDDPALDAWHADYSFGS